MFVSFLLCTLLPLTNATDVMSAVCNYKERVPFVLRGTVACVIEPIRHEFVLVDDSGSAALVDDRSKIRQTFDLQPGDTLCVTGNVSRKQGNVSAPCNVLVRTGSRPPPEPQAVTIADLKTGRYDGCFVSVDGIVRESFRDEIDPQFTFLVLADGVHAIYVTIYADEASALRLHALTGARVSVRAVCQPIRAGQRRQLGRTLALCNARAITVFRQAGEAPFETPPIDSSARHSPDQILAMGRRRVTGRVLALWQGNRAILRDDDGNIHNVGLVEAALPAYGDDIEAEGFAATDLYRINLTSATWRKRNGAQNATNPPPFDVEADNLFLDNAGRNKLFTGIHGTTIRIRGTVLDLPEAKDRRDRLTLKCGEHTLPVDASACRSALDGISVGCTVEVTGCCAVETENWHSYSAFPHATGITVILRTSDDLVLLAEPPWWTTGRLVAVIGSLAAFLVLMFVWSLSLWRIAIRRGHQLFRAQIEQMGSELRVEERTRLAVELHDSISQNLTGVSMQIDAAKRWLDTTPDRTKQHLDVASQTLNSSREELRNCIWDLRSQAVEAKDMNEAVRRTLQQRLGGAALTVRFNVPRARLTDNTTHAILRIIRELSGNAVRHGHATAVKVAGTVDGGRLLFSVSDNGGGFDPDTRPGIGEGHFGLQGIAERIRSFGGTLEIESAVGKGCRVSVSLKMPHGGKENG